ncbi:ubiquitin carboxyl-terminal hydrolase 17-like protein 6 [Castor canadensis]|uniref:Ubiquitin carboxyl-terminal hydrolase 17-like protein 6 n=2 Tax=Castor canadensis TaxID=51338 RepID=A0AC58K230_CASCN
MGEVFTYLREEDLVAVFSPKLCLVVVGKNHSSQYITANTFRDGMSLFQIICVLRNTEIESERGVPSWEDADVNKHESVLATDKAPKEKFCVTWKQPYVVGAGLQNLGNTCYMNATLQCLTYTAPLANYMLSQEHSQTCCPLNTCMICILQAHMIRALQHSGKVIQPLRALVTGFHKYKQEDAHEFLMFVLGAMQNSCLPGHKDLDPQAENTSLVCQLFGGYWRSQIKCLRCHGISDTFDPYLDISLDIKAAQSVQEALKCLVKPENLDGEEAYDCATCLSRVPATKTLTLKTVPKVLILVLKRFCDFTGVKIGRVVQYPECIDMQPYMSHQNTEPLVYVLYAVLVHAGLSCHSGHYLCYIKAGNGHWYEMDDAKVTPCGITSVLNRQAYVLFYVQKSELNGHSIGFSHCEEQSLLEVADQDMGAQQRELHRPSNMQVGEPCGHKEDSATKEITLDQWKILQQQNRPKSELNIRKIEGTLPSNGIMIHPSKYRMGMRKNHTEKEIYLPAQCSKDTGHLPCVGMKKKGKPDHQRQEFACG